jgi:hypothetical protein
MTGAVGTDDIKFQTDRGRRCLNGSKEVSKEFTAAPQQDDAVPRRKARIDTAPKTGEEAAGQIKGH